MLQVLFRIRAVSESQVYITRVGRSTVRYLKLLSNRKAHNPILFQVYVTPKGETGRLDLSQEGTSDKGPNKTTEQLWLGDTVVVVGTCKYSYVMLPKGQNWFEWAQGNRDQVSRFNF